MIGGFDFWIECLAHLLGCVALCVGFYVWNVTSLVLGRGGCGGVFRAFGFGYYVWWFRALWAGWSSCFVFDFVNCDFDF